MIIKKKTYLTWKALLVPLWSKSWHKHAVIKANISTASNFGLNSPVYETEYKNKKHFKFLQL